MPNKSEIMQNRYVHVAIQSNEILGKTALELVALKLKTQQIFDTKVTSSRLKMCNKNYTRVCFFSKNQFFFSFF